MKKFIEKYVEKNKILKMVEFITLVITIISTISLYVVGLVKVNQKADTNLTYVDTITMTAEIASDDYDDDSTKCDVIYYDSEEENYVLVTYTFDEWSEIVKQGETHSITAHGYRNSNGELYYFNVLDPNVELIENVVKEHNVRIANPLFSMATSLLIFSISLAVVFLFSQVFTTYEKCWFMSIMILATVLAIFLPEESANGVSGLWIMLLYLLDTFLNILCELLISKQSRWNFIVSLAVEATEILICVVLMYRFATMISTLFFWIPIDIISFINWSRKKNIDEEEEDLTKVRRLTGWQEVVILISIGVWTVVVGYLLSGLDITSDIFKGNELKATIVCYLDACATAVGICNGVFIWLRIREQWIAWFVEALLEGAINIISGQYILLVLKLGYLTNSTYGFIKWTKYIKSRNEEKLELESQTL